MWLFFTLATTLLWGVAELFYKKVQPHPTTALLQG